MSAQDIDRPLAPSVCVPTFAVSFMPLLLPAFRSSGSPAVPKRSGGRGRRILLLALGATSVSACVPRLGPLPTMVDAAGVPSSRSLSTSAGSWPRTDWWRAYGDPQLDALIDEALEGSPSLLVADARAHRALGAIGIAGAATEPELAANGSVEAVRGSRNLGYPGLIKDYLPRGVRGQARSTIDFAFDLDFFGRNRAALAAATSEAEAAAMDAAAARLQLSAAVAAAYAELGRLFYAQAAAGQALRVRRDTLTLLNRRFAGGLANRGELEQQASLVPVVEGELSEIDSRILEVRHTIAALLGAGPDRGLAITPPAAAALEPFGLPATLRLDLVGRRPDLVAARRRVEAAGHRIDVAKADFYPNVNLAAFFGIQSLGLSGLFTQDALTGAAGPALSLPIFSGRRLRGNYGRSRADYEEAVGAYNQLLVDALRDIADLVTQERSIREQREAAERAENAAAAAYDSVRHRFAAGLTTYLDVLTAESGLIDRRRTVADLKARSLLLDIALARAIGGGFADPRPTRN